MALILQHPRAPKPVLHAYQPVTAASVIAAISACNAERKRLTEVSGVVLPMVLLPDWCLVSIEQDIRR